MNDIANADNESERDSPGIRLQHTIVVKAPGLLPMRYTIHELAEELCCSERMLRAWINTGMPYERDARGHLWVVGTAFTAWINTKHKQAETKVPQPGTAYCMKCRVSVSIAYPTEYNNGKHLRLRGTCPNCGITVYRGVKSG